MQKILKGVFPDYFPPDFCECFLPEGAKENEISLYRIGKYGNNDRKAFIDSYGEVYLGIRKMRNKDEWLLENKNNISMLSTSFFEKYEDIKYVYDVTLKCLPLKIILFGKINNKDGFSQPTRERERNREDTHVDVWLYKHATPEINFTVCKDGELNG